jgi:8-oxo-dGTP pyrophosphatase MutT (NUDIX family)
MAGSAVSRLLAAYPSDSPKAGTAGAAVFIVLREGRHDVESLLIERATRPEDPASGQVSLPGGHVDVSDVDLRATAVRELEEEVGLRRADLVEPIRYIDTVEARRFSMSVGVFAAALSSASRSPASYDPAEVVSVFWLPTEALRRRSVLTWPTPQGPVELPAVRHEGHVVWGFTLRVLNGLLGPSRSRTVRDRPATRGPARSASPLGASTASRASSRRSPSRGPKAPRPSGGGASRVARSRSSRRRASGSPDGRP